ncbi:MAG TPA: Spy/CpxP family protein refolding chaperone [Burkholderiaceae bacterium]|nr:Spy/CpxP family protein refolding chaperone [Burkholderiaceae bacterium]
MTQTSPIRTSFPRAARLAASTVLVALLGSVALSAFAQGGPGPGPGPYGGPGMHAGPGMGGGPGMHMMAGRGLERMLDGVNASADQKAQIKQIAERTRAEMQAQRESHRALREQMAKAFAAPTVDANAIEALRQQMLQQHDAQSRRMTQAMVEASRVLTPEQRKQIVERMAARRDMMQRHLRERQQLEGGRPGPR